MTLATGLPFRLVCLIPLVSDPLYFLPIGVRITLTHALLPITCMIVEMPSRLPSYMGFFIGKSISMAWQLLKTYGYVPRNIPGEKKIGLSILAAIVGIISVKKAQMEAHKKIAAAKSGV